MLGMVHWDLSLCQVIITDSSHWLRLHGVVTISNVDKYIKEMIKTYVNKRPFRTLIIDESNET